MSEAEARRGFGNPGIAGLVGIETRWHSVAQLDQVTPCFRGGKLLRSSPKVASTPTGSVSRSVPQAAGSRKQAALAKCEGHPCASSPIASSKSIQLQAPYGTEFIHALDHIPMANSNPATATGKDLSPTHCCRPYPRNLPANQHLSKSKQHEIHREPGQTPHVACQQALAENRSVTRPAPQDSWWTSSGTSKPASVSAKMAKPQSVATATVLMPRIVLRSSAASARTAASSITCVTSRIQRPDRLFSSISQSADIHSNFDHTRYSNIGRCYDRNKQKLDPRSTIPYCGRRCRSYHPVKIRFGLARMRKADFVCVQNNCGQSSGEKIWQAVK